MSTDPAFTVEWTVPTDDDEWGDDVPGATDPDVSVERTAPDTTESEELAAREPSDLPPRPVLAARVDHLRSERAAREREVDAVRDRYETLLAERNATIRELRENESRLETLARRVSRFF